MGGMKEHCGVFGVYDHPDAAQLTYLGLYALQHRGQESAGIAISDNSRVTCHLGMGLVTEVFPEQRLTALGGRIAAGHVRYSTTGASDVRNAQPFCVGYQQGSIAIAHNGNLVNSRELKQELEAGGSIFQSTMDSEIIVHLIARSKARTLEERVAEALSRVRGAYSLVILTGSQLIAARDPNGFRPLCIGHVDEATVLASETCALDLIRARYLREVEPGEIVTIDDDGMRSLKPFEAAPQSFCIFELIYFARPDSLMFCTSVHTTRKRQGKRLADEHPTNADLVMPIPDSGNAAALGFAESSGLPFDMGIVRNHYVGRTFIQPSARIRDLGVRVKLNPVPDVVGGKRVGVIEDSIVRGTTSRARMRALRDSGAREVHMRVSCPPLTNPCFYGIDFHTTRELVASSRSVPEIAEYIGVDSLGYLSLEGLLASMPAPAENFCLACFTGQYPVEVPKGLTKSALER